MSRLRWPSLPCGQRRLVPHPLRAPTMMLVVLRRCTVCPGPALAARPRQDRRRGRRRKRSTRQSYPPPGLAPLGRNPCVRQRRCSCTGNTPLSRDRSRWLSGISALYGIPRPAQREPRHRRLRRLPPSAGRSGRAPPPLEPFRLQLTPAGRRPARLGPCPGAPLSGPDALLPVLSGRPYRSSLGLLCSLQRDPRK